MSNKIYDFLKYIALIALPAAAALYAGLAMTWGWGHTEQILCTLTLTDTFLGALLQLSKNKYNKGGNVK